MKQLHGETGKIIYLLFIAVLLGSCLNTDTGPEGAKADKPARRLDSLQWITGSWELANEVGLLVETWERKNDTFLSGSSFMLSAKDTLFSEKISLVQSGSGIYYVPVVSGQNDGRPVIFPLVSSKDGNWVFENPAHDFPQRIIYSHPHPDSLSAIISGTDKGRERQEVFRMKKKRPNN